LAHGARGKEWPSLIRELEAVKPFQVLVTSGFEYLCKVKDMAIGLVLAHTMADNMSAELVTETINKAKGRWNCPKAVYTIATLERSTLSKRL
jgi:hypothetical protein